MSGHSDSVLSSMRKGSHCGSVKSLEVKSGHYGSVSKGVVIKSSVGVPGESRGSYGHSGSVVVSEAGCNNIDGVETKGLNSKLCVCGKVYEGITGDMMLVELYEHVKQSGKYNFEGCRIPVPESKKFNLKLWREKLKDYDDRIVCDYLEFGFPIDFDKEKKLVFDVRKNHKGAREFPEFITNYLRRECEGSRIAGPFKKNPLSSQLVVSPMNSVPKSDSEERRVIVDLSWPHGSSVNDGISKNVYLGEEIELHYTSVERVCHLVRRMGKGSVIYKRDLKRAYRQFPVDPSDYGYLGYFWDGMLYFDSVLCMGQRNAAMACSRATESVMFIHRQSGHEGESYLDDLIGVSPAQSGEAAFVQLGDLLSELGLIENLGKACPPATIQLVLGILINTVEGTMSVPPERMKDIHSLLHQWKRKQKSTKVELQSLIGVLQYVTKCVWQSRVFLNRMLELLRSFHDSDTSKTLSISFKKDVNWWWVFMERFNGVSYIPDESWNEPDVVFSTDSCLSGCGGTYDKEFFHATFPENIRDQNLPIHQLEMLAVLVGVRFWGKYCAGGKIQIFCDNESCVKVLNSGRTRDPFLGACLREIWLEASQFGFELRAIHLPGVENRVADWLSRWDVHEDYRKLFYQFVGEDEQYRELSVGLEMFELSEKF